MRIEPGSYFLGRKTASKASRGNDILWLGADPTLELGSWGFPKIRDPNIVPLIVGSLLERPQNKVP